MSASTSLTSLPAIDVSLNIELPPPITSEILPIISRHSSTAHQTNTLPPSNHSSSSSENRDQSHKHIYRSPKPFDLPCTSTSPSTSTYEDSSARNHYSTLPRVPSTYLSPKSQLDEKQHDDKNGDVVSLYGTAQQFRTRIKIGGNLPSAQKDFLILHNNKHVSCSASSSTNTKLTFSAPRYSRMSMPQSHANISKDESSVNSRKYPKPSLSKAVKNDDINIPRANLIEKLTFNESYASKLRYSLQPSSKKDSDNICSEANSSSKINHKLTRVDYSNKGIASPNYTSAYSDRIARQEIKSSSKAESNTTKSKVDDISLPKTKFREQQQQPNNCANKQKVSKSHATDSRTPLPQPTTVANSNAMSDSKEEDVCTSTTKNGSKVRSRSSPPKYPISLERSVSCCVPSSSVNVYHTVSSNRGSHDRYPNASSLHNKSNSISTLGCRVKSFPKYDASKQFSESLAAFSSKGKNSEYFYSSSLSRSRGGSLADIDNENLEASDLCGEINSLLSRHPSGGKMDGSTTQFLLGPYRGHYSTSYRHGVRPYSRPSLDDVMTRSLPVGISQHSNAFFGANNYDSKCSQYTAAASSCPSTGVCYPSLPSNYTTRTSTRAAATTSSCSSSKYNSLPSRYAKFSRLYSSRWSAAREGSSQGPGEVFSSSVECFSACHS